MAKNWCDHIRRLKYFKIWYKVWVISCKHILGPAKLAHKQKSYIVLKVFTLSLSFKKLRKFCLTNEISLFRYI